MTASPNLLRNALWSGAALIGLALCGGGIYVAWDRGLIPGNPRAPSAHNMLPAVQGAYALSARDRIECVALDLSPPPDVQGVPGITARLLPGQHRSIYLLQTEPRLQEFRDRQLQQLRFLTKQNFFAETDAEIETSAGRQTAKEFRLTWDGFKSLASTPAHDTPAGDAACFAIGTRALGPLTQIERLPDTLLDTELWRVTYDLALKDLAPWAATAEAAQLFPGLASKIRPVVESTNLLRAKSGWVSHAQAQTELLTGIPARYTAPTSDLLQSPSRPDDNVIKAAMELHLAGELAARSALACLPLPSGRSALVDKSGQSPAYLSGPAGGPGGHREQVAHLNALHLLLALQSAGLAERMPAEPSTSAQPDPGAARAGLRFQVNPEAVQALRLDTVNACVPAGKMRVELLKAWFENDRSARLTGVGQLTQVPAWVQKLAMHLPALQVTLETGVPYTGIFEYQTIGTTMPGKWSVRTLRPSYPTIHMPTLPASLHPEFPEFAAASKPAVKGWSPDANLPFVAPTLRPVPAGIKP